MKNMKKIQVLSILTVSSMVLGACSLLPGKTTSVEPEKPIAMVKDEQPKNMETKPVRPDSLQENTNETVMDSETTSYQEYSSSAVEAAVSQGKTVVLFFHAGWCPTCREADSDIKSNLSEIPANVVVFKTDYDSEDDLKKKYAVTYQHTFVQIDENHELVTSWNGGNASDISKRIK
jgi:thiol-disulfide isomerase/thioredoxin